jgi:hypothetical protein
LNPLEWAILASLRNAPAIFNRSEQERKAAARRRRLGNFQAAEFDQLWIVFDTDVPERHGKLHDGLGFAEANGVRCAHSTPCFEFWLLLHLRYTTAPMRVCAEAVERLSQELHTAYTKNGSDAEKLVPPFLNGLELAVVHAGRVRAHHAAANTAFPPNPSTEMDRLILAVRETVAPVAAGDIEARAKRGSLEAFDRILAKVPDVPPLPGDELQAGSADDPPKKV